MAYIKNPQTGQDEEEDGASAPPTTGAGPTYAGGGAPSGAAPAESTGGSGKFAGFQRILDLNRSSVDAGVNRLAGEAERRATAVQSNVGADVGRFRSEADAAAKGAQGRPYEYYAMDPGVGPVQQVGWEAGVYKGPTDFDSFVGQERLGEHTGAIQDTEGYLQNLTRPEGRQALLQQNAPATYSRGASNWDSALLGSAGQDRFSELQQRYANLAGVLDGARQEARSTVAGVQPTIDEANFRGGQATVAENVDRWDRIRANVGDNTAVAVTPIPANAHVTDDGSVISGGGRATEPAGYIDENGNYVRGARPSAPSGGSRAPAAPPSGRR